MAKTLAKIEKKAAKKKATNGIHENSKIVKKLKKASARHVYLKSMINVKETLLTPSTQIREARQDRSFKSANQSAIV